MLALVYTCPHVYRYFTVIIEILQYAILYNTGSARDVPFAFEILLIQYGYCNTRVIPVPVCTRVDTCVPTRVGTYWYTRPCMDVYTGVRILGPWVTRVRTRVPVLNSMLQWHGRVLQY